MINPLATTGLDAMNNELVAIIREAQHRQLERADPSYRRPSPLVQRLADLEAFQSHRRTVAAARLGDETALRTLAAERIEIDQQLAELKQQNKLTEQAIRTEPDEPEFDDTETGELQW